MNETWNQFLNNTLDDFKLNGLLRTLQARDPRDASVINLATNDYLNLSKDPRVIEAAHKAMLKCGTSSSGSPVVAGYFPIHEALEHELSSWIGLPHGMLWSSGFSANQAILRLLPQKGDIILADEFVHYSMIAGALQSPARILRYRHCDIEHLESLLARFSKKGHTTFVLTESVFSMDGDYPDLKAMASLKQRTPFIWIVDEAHALGWYGPRSNGLIAECLAQEHVDILIATLGKSLASQGAFALFNDRRIRDLLITASKELMYSTYPSPACIGAASQAIKIIKNELYPKLSYAQQQSRELRLHLKNAGLNTLEGESPVIAIIIGDNASTLYAGNQLRNYNIITGTIRPPSVPQNTGRLRLSINIETQASNLAPIIIEALKPQLITAP